MAIWQIWTSSIKSFYVQQKWLVHRLWWGRLSSHAHSWGLWWQNPEQRTCLPHDPSQLISIIVSRLSNCLWSAAHSYSRGAVKGTAGFLLKVREICIQTMGGSVLLGYWDIFVSDGSPWKAEWQIKGEWKQRLKASQSAFSWQSKSENTK